MHVCFGWKPYCTEITVRNLCFRAQYASFRLYWVKHMEYHIQGFIVCVQLNWQVWLVANGLAIILVACSKFKYLAKCIFFNQLGQEPLVLWSNHLISLAFISVCSLNNGWPCNLTGYNFAIILHVFCFYTL